MYISVSPNYPNHLSGWCQTSRGMPFVTKLIADGYLRKLVNQPISLKQGRRHLNLNNKVYGPTWDPSGADRTQVDPMLAPWTLQSGKVQTFPCSSFCLQRFSVHALSVVFNNVNFRYVVTDKNLSVSANQSLLYVIGSFHPGSIMKHCYKMW